MTEGIEHLLPFAARVPVVCDLVLAWLGRVAHRVDRSDRRLTRLIEGLPRSPADGALQEITRTADHGLLWFTVAAVLASRRGVTRRAAVRGVLAIGGASFTANVLGKPLLPRRRPAADALPTWRTLPDPPTSSSFPSGHAASAAAFCTAVALESPRAGAALLPLAATIAYSRVHVGVHWPSDVFGGVIIGTAVALGTLRWWPHRPLLPAKARSQARATALPDGESLIVVINPRSGVLPADPTGEIGQLLPAARTLDMAATAGDVARQLDAAIGGETRAVGVAGGDGSVAAVAAVAAERGLPLAVLPTGTLNHFARDVGVESPAAAAAALATGSAVAVDLAAVTVDGAERRALVNTASLGGYPDLVRLRERWRRRIGKWPAAALALVKVMAAAKPLILDVDARPVAAWLLFVGNGPYEPRGMAPAWRPALDSGLLDIRYIRADVPLSRTRFVLAALTGTLRRSLVYVQRESPELRVGVHGPPVALATDGEVGMRGNTFEFTICPTRLVVYRP
jgi:diacylglycerol kinase family enzyme/membrane-associated phospholipid phosphatase